jgi:hypothetical protein
VLAGMLAAAGILHIRLLEDLEGRAEWAVAVAIGTIGVAFNLAAGLVLGLAAWWLPRLLSRMRPAEAAS